MASGNAMLAEEATVFITPSGTAASTNYSVTAEVTNFSESGGEEDLESRQVFGGGNIDLLKPRTQMEVSFDVILRYGDDARKWDEYKWSSTFTSAGDAPLKDIYVQFTDGTLYYTRAYRNARAFTWEPSLAADGMVEGSITFKMSPTTADGNANFQVTSTAATSVSWA